MKKIIVLFVAIFNCIFGYATSPIGIINNDEKVFMKISASIANQLPKNVQILVYNINYLNMDYGMSETINKDFKNIMMSQQFINNYKIFFIDDVKAEHPEYDYSFLNILNDQELINFGQIVGTDVVLIATATLMRDKNKTVWDSNKRRFEKKKVVLFQANIFNTKSKTNLMRISEYFVVR